MTPRNFRATGGATAAGESTSSPGRPSIHLEERISMKRLLSHRPRRAKTILAAAVATCALAVAGSALAAGGETPVTVKVGNLELTANGGFSPTAISKTKQTPIELKASGEVKEADNNHPPAVRELIIEGDKNAEVHVKGIPVCTSGQLQATDDAAAEKACKSALIGEGTTTAQVAFAAQK